MNSIELSFETPVTRKLKAESIAILNEASTLLLPEEKNWPHIYAKHKELASEINRIEDINAPNPTIRNVDIGDSYESDLYHLDARDAENTETPRVITLCSNFATAVFAACQMEVFETCVDMINTDIEEEIASGDTEAYTFEDLLSERDTDANILSEVFFSLRNKFGNLWLEDAHSIETRPIHSYLRVSGLVISHYPEHTLATGEVGKTLHKTPDYPPTTARALFKAIY